jgi:hypothetical protein
MAGLRVGVLRRDTSPPPPAEAAALAALAAQGCAVVGGLELPSAVALSAAAEARLGPLVLAEAGAALGGYLAARSAAGGGGPGGLPALLAFNAAEPAERAREFGQDLLEAAADAATVAGEQGLLILNLVCTCKRVSEIAGLPRLVRIDHAARQARGRRRRAVRARRARSCGGWRGRRA